MDERTQGLILRTRLLTETSLIVQWLTPDLGRISTVAKGARRAKSPLRGKLDLFYLADFSFQRSRRSELHQLREVLLREMHAPLRRDLMLLRQASYAAALVEQSTETETPVPQIYALMQELLEFLPTQPLQASTVFAFELRLLEQQGLQPDIEKSALSPGSKVILQKLAQDAWTALPRLKLSARQISEVSAFLNRFLAYHLGKVPANRAAALGTEAETGDGR